MAENKKYTISRRDLFIAAAMQGHIAKTGLPRKDDPMYHRTLALISEKCLDLADEIILHDTR